MKHPITVIRDENLEDVKFNVKTVPMAFYPNGFTAGDEQIGGLLSNTKDFKGIVNDGGNLISVVKKDYKLASNREMMESVINRLVTSGVKYNIDTQHSYYNEERMILHLTLPE